jgi:hypothetical protein
MRWVGHVTRVGDRRGAYRVLVAKPRQEEKLILERNFKNWDGDEGNGLFWLKIGAGDGLL